MKANVFTAHTDDMKQEEIGEYYPYDYCSEIEKRPQKVGDLVILQVYPHFDDIMEQFKYEQEDKYPPEYYVIAQVTRFTDSGGFFCKPMIVDIEER